MKVTEKLPSEGICLWLPKNFSVTLKRNQGPHLRNSILGFYSKIYRVICLITLFYYQLWLKQIENVLKRTQRLAVYCSISTKPPVSKLLSTSHLPLISYQPIANLSCDGPMAKYVEKAVFAVHCL